MHLREALDLCSDLHSDDWVEIPGSRPATGMLATFFDPGTAEPRTRALTGHSIGVYEPDARLAIVWPVPEDDDDVVRPGRSRDLPEFLEADSRQWKSARREWGVVVVCGSPVWQEPIWYADWGSGIGGYVPEIRPILSESPEEKPAGWEATEWAIHFVGLINRLAGSYQWHEFDPTPRLVAEPQPQHPIDLARE